MSKAINDIDQAINEMFDGGGLKADILRTVEQLNPPHDDTPVVREPTIVPTNQEDTEKYVRQKICDVIGGGEEALGELLVLAKSLQHPQAYDAIAKLIKQITESAIALSKVKVESKEPSGPKKVTNIQNNITLTGSLSDILSGNTETKK